MSDVRLIDANALMEKFGDVSLMLRMDGFLDSVGEAEIISMIGNAPTIEPKQGEWISNHDGYWICPECGLRVREDERSR